MSEKKTDTVPTITVDIRSDHAHSGKTTIAAVIIKALEAHGFDGIIVNSTDGDIKAKMEYTPQIGDLRQQPQVILNDLNAPLMLDCNPRKD